MERVDIAQSRDTREIVAIAYAAMVEYRRSVWYAETVETRAIVQRIRRPVTAVAAQIVLKAAVHNAVAPCAVQVAQRVVDIAAVAARVDGGIAEQDRKAVGARTIKQRITRSRATIAARVYERRAIDCAKAVDTRRIIAVAHAAEIFLCRAKQDAETICGMKIIKN